MSEHDRSRLRIGAVQAAPVWLDGEATLEKACALVRKAGSKGIDFLGFPENFIPGHPVWFYYYPATSRLSMDLAVRLYKNSVEIPGAWTDALCRAAAEANVFVVMGLTERRPDQTGTLYNTQLFIDREGSIVGKHQKLVPTIGERIVHMGGSGRSLRTFASEFGPVSGLCCGENSNPLAIAVLAAEYTRLHVACWPNHFIPGYLSMPESSLLVSRNVAYMCKSFVVSAAATNGSEMIEALSLNGDERQLLLDGDVAGGSAIVDPTGTVIAGPLHGGEEGLLSADIDLDATIRGRVVHDFGGHYNRPDLMRLLVRDGEDELVARVPDHAREPVQAPDSPPPWRLLSADVDSDSAASEVARDDRRPG